MAPADSRSRISNCPSPPRTGAPAASPGASQKAAGPRPATRAALCQGVHSPGPNAGRAAALPAHWARASPGWVSRRTRLFTLEGRLLLSPGGDPLRTTAARGCGGVAHAVRKPLTGPSPDGSPSWEYSEESFHAQTPPPARAHRSRHKVSFCTEGGAAYLGVWAQARRARRGRRTGAPGLAAWWGRPASAAAPTTNCAGTCVPSRSAGAEGRGLQPHAPRAAGAHSALGRAGGGGGCAGPRPAATIPPAALATRSKGRRCLGSPAGTPGVSPLGTARAGSSGRGGAGSALRPQLSLREAPRAEAPPRAGTLCPSPPPLPFLPPARQAPLSSPPSSFSSLPFQAPARLPHGQFTARRGGAGRAPGRASSALRRDQSGTRGGGRPGGRLFPRALGAGARNRWVGSGWAFTTAGSYRKGAGHAPPGVTLGG